MINFIPLAQMIKVVEIYIYSKKRIQVKIIPPRNDKELQMLGLAYDIIQDILYNGPINTL